MPTFDPPGFDSSIEAREELFLYVSLVSGRPQLKGLGSGVQKSSTDVGNMGGGKAPRPAPHQVGDPVTRATMAALMFHAGLRRIEIPNGDTEAFYNVYLEWYAAAEARV